MSQYIDEFCNDLANYNDNFLNLKQESKMKQLFEIKEVCKYDGTRYFLYIDGSCHKMFYTYEEAFAEFTLAINFRETTTTLVSKEVEL